MPAPTTKAPEHRNPPQATEERIADKGGLARGATVAAAFFLAGLVSALIYPGTERIVGIAPQAGIALAAMLVWGPARMALPVWLAGVAFIWSAGLAEGEASSGTPFSACTLMCSLGPVVQGWLGTWLIRRLCPYPGPVDTLPQSLRFVLLSGPVPALAGATLTTVALVTHGQIAPEEFTPQWLHDYLANGLGAAIVTPILLVWIGSPQRVWRRRVVSMAVPLTILLGALGVALAVAANAERRERELAFSMDATLLREGLRNRLSHALEIPGELRALAVGDGTSDPRGFTNLASARVGSDPGTLAIEWVGRVRGRDRGAWEASHSPPGQRPVVITERDASGRLVRAADRPLYFPVESVDPPEGNGAAIGFDLGSEPVRLGTLRRAAETGRLAVTGRVNLIQFQTNSAGVLAFVPLYEGDALPPTAEARWERLRGLTLAVIRVHDLIHLSIPPDRQGDFDLLIEDPTAAASARILYDSGDTIALHADDDLKLVTTLPVGDREWSLRLYPTEAYLGRHPPRLCRALEGLSLVASCLLVSFLLVITGRGARVEQLVSERTRELERQMKLAHLASSISAAIASEGEFRPRLEECMRLIISHLDAAFARIWTLDATGGVLELQASAGLYTHINGGHARVPVGSYKIGLIASERRPHLTNEVENDPRIGDPQWARREGMKAFAGYPLLSGDRLVGVVALFARQALDDATLEALESIAEKLGLFIDRQAALIALQASEAHIRLIVDTALDGVVTVDAHGVVLGWNIQAERIFGWQASEAMGRPVSELIVPPEMRAAHLAGIEAFRRTGIGTILGKRIEVTGQRRNGDRFPMELSVNPVSTNAGTGFSAFMRDISDRKQAETRLQDAARAIEEANARLHQSLLQAEKLAEEAQAANKAKSEFLATMSHEIRTPMNGILGFVQLLSDTPLNPEQREFTGIIRQSGDALLSIIDDILDFSKVEAGKLTLNCAPFDVLPVVQEVVGLLTPKAAEKGLHLTLKLAANQPGQVVGDPARVRQVVTNLVGNAIKFTETGGVTVEMECGPPPGGDPHDSRQHLRISVLDTGIGISEEKQRLLFQKFTQLDSSTTRRFGGTGLGLAISKQLITLMNGRVGCTSAPGRGSTFWFSIPLATATAIQRNACALPPPSRAATPTSPTPPAPRLDPSAPSDALTVILAEDNSTNRALARRLVEKCGFRVETAVNGREAVEKSAADGCIAILMDCDMPEMDGFEATHAIRLRERATGGRLPIIALTANAMAGDREKCLEAGMDDYLSKPVKFPDLQATLARWVASSQPAPPLKQP